METQNLEVDTLPECRPGSPCRTQLLFLSSAFELCPPVLACPAGTWLSPKLTEPSYRLFPECSPNPLPIQLPVTPQQVTPHDKWPCPLLSLFYSWHLGPLISRRGFRMPRGSSSWFGWSSESSSDLQPHERPSCLSVHPPPAPRTFSFFLGSRHNVLWWNQAGSHKLLLAGAGGLSKGSCELPGVGRRAGISAALMAPD